MYQNMGSLPHIWDNRFFDPSVPSMRKGHGVKTGKNWKKRKKEKRNENNNGNSSN